MCAANRVCKDKLVAKNTQLQKYRDKFEKEREKYTKLKEFRKLHPREQIATSATYIPSGSTVIYKEAVLPPTAAEIAEVNCVVPPKDGCSNDTTSEEVVTSYEQKICILTSNLNALKKELTLEHERRRNVESELTNNKEYVEKLLGELRKADSSNVKLANGVYYDAEKLVAATAK